MKRIITLTFTILFVSCSSKKEVSGKYVSNFADLGFFVTKLDLKKDGNLNFEYSGDLVYKNYTGKYFVKANNLYLLFDDEKEKKIKIDDTDRLYSVLDFSKSHNYKLKYEDGISYHLKYKIKNNKLFVYNIQTYKIVRKAKKGNRYKSFYLLKII